MNNESKAVELLRRAYKMLRDENRDLPSNDYSNWYEWYESAGDLLDTYDAAPQEPDAVTLMRQVEALTPGGSEFVMPDGWDNAIRFISARLTSAAAIAKERNELRAQQEAQR